MLFHTHQMGRAGKKQVLDKTARPATCKVRMLMCCRRQYIEPHTVWALHLSFQSLNRMQLKRIETMLTK